MIFIDHICLKKKVKMLFEHLLTSLDHYFIMLLNLEVILALLQICIPHKGKNKLPKSLSPENRVTEKHRQS